MSLRLLSRPQLQQGPLRGLAPSPPRLAASAYFLAKTTAEAGICVVAPLFFASIAYWCVRRREKGTCCLSLAGLGNVLASSPRMFELPPHLQACCPAAPSRPCRCHAANAAG